MHNPSLIAPLVQMTSETLTCGNVFTLALARCCWPDLIQSF